MIARFCRDFYWRAKNIKGEEVIMTNSEKCKKYDVFKSGLVEGASFSPVYEFPLVKQTVFKPMKAIPFDKAISSTKYDHWIHFYIHDRQFERIWNNPKQYLAFLKRFQGVITPDFSLYRDLPLAMQIWNTYRNRAVAYWLQSNGVNIVPNIRWGDERTYSFAFEGIENKGVLYRLAQMDVYVIKWNATISLKA